MKVNAIRNLNLSKVKKHSGVSFARAAQSKVSPDVAKSETKKSSYIPRMLLVMGIGVAILLATNKVFKTKTAPFSYLWK